MIGADKEWNKKRGFLLAFFSAVFISLDFARYVLTLESSECEGIMIWIKDSNLHFYLVMILIFLGVFFSVRIIFLALEFTAEGNGMFHISEAKQHVIVALPSVLILGSLLYWLCVKLDGEFPYDAHGMWPLYSVPKVLAAIFLAAGMLWVVYIAAGKRDLPNACLYIVYALCLILYFSSIYCVNVFKGDIHHKVAVFESIYNVCDFIPYTELTSGIYGHYGLFFLPPMRMAHGSLYMLAFVIALFGCVTEAATIYVCHKLLQKNVLRAAAACSSIFFVAVSALIPYWQVFPIRVVFPMVMCAYACFLAVHKKLVWCTRWMWLGYLLSSAAILWNTESGIFCVIAFCVYILMEQLQRHQWYEKYMMKMYVVLLLLSIFSLALAIGIVNAYNFFCGGGWILQEFFFPLFCKSYMDGVLRYDPPWGNHAWIYTFVLFMAVMAWALFHTRIFQDKLKKAVYKAPAAAVIAMCGLMLFSYYLNRAAYGNLCICFHFAICANALVIGETWPALRYHSRVISLEILARRAVAIVSIVIVVFLAVQMPFGIGQIEERREIGIYGTKDIEKELSDIAENIPENTYGVGCGISVLYHMLGWNNYAHVRDSSGFYINKNDAADVVLNEILGQDRFLLNDWQLNLTPKLFLLDPYYKLVEAFHVEGFDYCYYERCEEKVTDWLPRLIAASGENEKTADGRICISPDEYIAGTNIFMNKGEYMLSVTTDGRADLEICYGGKVRMRRKLAEGENNILYTIPVDVDSSEFKIVNTCGQEIRLSHLDMQAM